MRSRQPLGRPRGLMEVPPIEAVCSFVPKRILDSFRSGPTTSWQRNAEPRVWIEPSIWRTEPSFGILDTRPHERSRAIIRGIAEPGERSPYTTNQTSLRGLVREEGKTRIATLQTRTVHARTQGDTCRILVSWDPPVRLACNATHGPIPAQAISTSPTAAKPVRQSTGTMEWQRS